MSEFRMPSLGADMEAGKLVQWLKGPGDRVERGDIVAVVETQKGAIEVEVFTSGVLDRHLVEPGMVVPVGTPLAVIRDGAEEAPAAAIAPPSVPVTAAPRSAARPVALSPALPQVRATPGARRLAAEKGVDLSAVKGTGPGGAVIEGDVLKAVAAPQRPGLDLAAMRQAIAAAMARSKREIPHYYLSLTLDLGPAREWLTRINEPRPPGERLLLPALLIKATAWAVRKVPELNGFYLDGVFRPSEAIHVGFAVAIRGGGLVAPAIHHADTLGLDDLMAHLRDLGGRARSGGLRSSELSDPTITVTSLGERGADSVLPIITPPQVAVVGFGRDAIRPWVVDGEVVARPLLTATLGGDHRVSDGHRGGLLLAEIDHLLQCPEEL